jgi:hypothetical protein
MKISEQNAGICPLLRVEAIVNYTVVNVEIHCLLLIRFFNNLRRHFILLSNCKNRHFLSIIAVLLHFFKRLVRTSATSELTNDVFCNV